MLEIKWYARGGQGGFTSSKLLGLAAYEYSGQYAQAFPSFGPERRGAPVYGFTRIDSVPIRNHSQLYECDYAIVLDSTLMETIDVTKGIRPGGILFINTTRTPEELHLNTDAEIICYDAAGAAYEVMRSGIVNTAMMAVVAAYTGIADGASMSKAVQEGMPLKLQEKNIQMVNYVYDAIRAELKKEGKA